MSIPTSRDVIPPHGPSQFKCGSCGMTFQLSASTDMDAEHTRCPTCRLRFWTADVAGRVRVGIDPDEAAAA